MALSAENSPLLRGSGRHPSQKSNQIQVSNVIWGIVGLVVGVLAMGLRSYRLEIDLHNAHHPHSKYSKVQGVGFQIYTGGAPAKLPDGRKNPECIGRNSYGHMDDGGDDGPILQCYVGHDDPLEDVRQRLELMREAVARAHELADPDPMTLKIFIAPEFFWRGVNGAYTFAYDENDDSFNECGAICEILKGLEEIVAQQKFENWLFVMGTVVASEALPTEDPYDFLFYNFAPLYKGYDPDKMDHSGKRFLVPKRYVSSSDFLTPRRFLNETAVRELIDEALPDHDTTVFNPFDFSIKRYDNDLWNKYKNELNNIGYTMIEYDWLMVDGISFTCEICFDHDRRSAKNTYLADIVTGRTTRIPSSSDKGLTFVPIPAYQAQISLVSSAGMTVTEDALALTNMGVIFLQDGLNNSSNRMYWGAMEGCEYTKGFQFDGGTEAVRREAILSKDDVFFEYRSVQIWT
ncbi:hypothetical protein FisN_17Hh159 [Fistulifera solaris]|uniref:Uncharacterized protein n=1 Tax=Fistulifera solaris TaxID=1519565 RepID=A0A1Z5JH26_FISSO|nr:hypothetical protein FisN_17Hh159 [Fistulifera solaris]|eukprot:GAX13226.1 hypothetical protein FisN_17Hh159 [Fistulifera solaris]